MKQTRTRILALGAGLLMAATVVTACGSSSETTSPSGESNTAGSSSPSSSSTSSSAPTSSSSSTSTEPSTSSSSSSAPTPSSSSSSAPTGAAGAVDLSKDTQKTVTIPIATGWAEDVAVSNLYKYVLEKKGFTVKTPELAIGPIFKGVAAGDYDIFFDTWLPNTHKDYWKQYGSKVDDIGIWYDKAPLTIAVPKYMKIDSMADLKSIGSKVDKTIIGIDPGAGLTRVTKTEMMPAYGLKKAGWTLKTSSTPAMLAALKKAISEKKPIVVTLWRPHWAYAAFPIKDLKDPKGAMGKPDSIHVIGSKAFTKADPGLVSILKNFHMDGDTLNSLEYSVLQKHKDDPQAGVAAWVKKNQDFVTKTFG